MNYLLEKKIKEFGEFNGMFNYNESEQIIEIIMREEGLTGRQAIHYNFDESFATYGSTWVNTKELVEYVEPDKPGSLETIRNILNTPTLHLLTTGRWIGWEY